MINFKGYRQNRLNEAFKAADTMKVAKLILSYFHKKLGSTYLYPSVEQFRHGSELYTTVTVLLPYEKSVRFNWLHGKLDQNSLHSVTIQEGASRKEVKFDKDVSLVQTLPLIIQILQHKITATTGEFYLHEDISSDGSILDEAKGDHPLDAVKKHIMTRNNGDRLVVSTMGLTALEYQLIRQVVAENPKAFDGYKIINKNAINWHGAETTLANSNVKFRIDPDKIKETWIKPAEIDETEAEEQISYIEKIEDLSNMLKFMVKGATNSVWVAGRGGCLIGTTEINVEI